MMSEKMKYKLVEMTEGPWKGKIWRYENMTEEEASERNSKIGVMKWEPCQ